MEETNCGRIGGQSVPAGQSSRPSEAATGAEPVLVAVATTITWPPTTVTDGVTVSPADTGPAALEAAADAGVVTPTTSIAITAVSTMSLRTKDIRAPYVRGSITGAGTFLGGFFHTLPFLIPQYSSALTVAIVVIVIELVTLAFIRWRFFNTGFLRSFASITLGGAIIVAISAALGAAG